MRFNVWLSGSLTLVTNNTKKKINHMQIKDCTRPMAMQKKRRYVFFVAQR